MYRLLTGITLAGTLLTPAHADEFGDAAMALCEKVKNCAMAGMEGEEVTPEMRQMMAPMLDNMCANMRSQFQEVATSHPVYEPALACMQSMTQQSCDALQEGDVQTAACREYEKVARQYDGG